MLEKATREALVANHVPPMVCRWCRLDAVHNPRLRITFCPVHGLESPLDGRNAPNSRWVRDHNIVRGESPILSGGSWAIPAG